ncbi:conserved hypothetical protein [Bacillus cereus W]|uniref:AAA family ATPase n=1 Tax=Bacillus anthracis TaxID=1392 RepID=UPI00016B2A62|nr:AAA family ATPase [Bacillus anthracis]EDX57143.1 conserved hypothetical protein [Bacillus cereus W]MEB9527576.1 AAA family ATPase [Bacillus anthracis]MEC0040296.1 AAA family ATPase [Bacillus anthracis]
MAYVISLQGPMASGKTTLAKKLELHGLSVIYENPYPIVEKRKQLNLDMNSKEGFIANQKMFIEAKIKEFQNAKGSVVIFDRGPEDIEFYTIFYPTTIGKEWDIETEKDWYKQFPVNYVDTNRLSADPLGVYFMKWLKGRGL